MYNLWNVFNALCKSRELFYLQNFKKLYQKPKVEISEGNSEKHIS